jgi:DNA-binding protein HU-beta
MNQSQIVSAVAALTGDSRTIVSQIINTFLIDIEDVLADGQKVTLSGFGTFLPVTRKSRKLFNLHTRNLMTLPSKQAIRFKPGVNIRYPGNRSQK